MALLGNLLAFGVLAVVFSLMLAASNFLSQRMNRETAAAENAIFAVLPASYALFLNVLMIWGNLAHLQTIFEICVTVCAVWGIFFSIAWLSKRAVARTKLKRPHSVLFEGAFIAGFFTLWLLIPKHSTTVVFNWVMTKFHG